MSALILRTDQLSRHVGDKTIVDAVTLQIARGEMIALIGPSGAGKTSLLRLLNRLDEPTGGTVYLEERDYRTIRPRELRQRVGLMLQTPHLFAGSVADNIRFGPRQRGTELPDAEIDALLEQVALAGYAGQDVQHLSGGEAQRVSLVRTLANKPQVLLLDEPTAALDDAAEHAVEQLICDLIRQHQMACLLITHKPAQAQRLAQRALQMEQGRMLKLAPIEEVLHAEHAL
jgi:putative ABC transport system ATP-binding protein